MTAVRWLLATLCIVALAFSLGFGLTVAYFLWRPL